MGAYQEVRVWLEVSIKNGNVLIVQKLSHALCMQQRSSTRMHVILSPTACWFLMIGATGEEGLTRRRNEQTPS